MVRNQVAKHFENMLGVPKEAGDGPRIYQINNILNTMKLYTLECLWGGVQVLRALLECTTAVVPSICSRNKGCLVPLERLNPIFCSDTLVFN